MNSGYVTLIGAGCGKDLITRKGLHILRRAEVVIYDDLIDPVLLLEVPENCETIYMGKRFGRHSYSQEEINQTLVTKAREGKAVIRLKGGDSFVFGRGGEEILALQAAGIAFDVVPGVTSAVAVPEDLGIPVTHRSIARSFTVVAGQSMDGTGENYAALAQLDGTILFLMGTKKLREICQRLMLHGKSGKTPAAVLSNGCSPRRRRIDGTLADIADRASGLESPTVLVIGETAQMHLLHDSRNSCQPLKNICVTLTGSEHFTGKLSELLTASGAQTVRIPLTEIIYLPCTLPADFSDYTWLVFTSSYGIDAFFTALKRQKTDFRKLAYVKFACTGSGTAARLAEYGFQPDFIPRTASAEALGRELCLHLSERELCRCPSGQERLLLLRAEHAAPELPVILRQNGIYFEEIAVYDTKPRRFPADAVFPEGYIVFASANGVDTFFRQNGKIFNAKPVCIGPSTAKRLSEYINTPVLVPEQKTAQEIVNLIINDCRRTEKNQLSGNQSLSSGRNGG